MTPETLEMLLRAHQAEVYRYLRYLGAERATAEDLAQETFLAAFQSRKTPDFVDIRGRCAWLRGIARNLFLQDCRRAARTVVTDDATALEEAETFWVNRFLCSGDGFDYVEALRKCLARLSARNRDVLRQRYAENRSRADMAAAAQMTEDGVKSLLRRIRAELAECIKRRLEWEAA